MSSLYREFSYVGQAAWAWILLSKLSKNFVELLWTVKKRQEKTKVHFKTVDTNF